jgi:hypothetical protein
MKSDAILMRVWLPYLLYFHKRMLVAMTIRFIAMFKELCNYMRITRARLLIYALILIIGQAHAAEVAVIPSNQIITPGAAFNMNVSIDPQGTAIAGAQVNIAFNRSLISVNSITEGDIFKQSEANMFFNSGIINNSAGIVINIFNAIIGKKNVSTRGTFIIINATAIGISGTSGIDLSNVKISDPNGNPVALNVTNGSVIINTPTSDTTPPASITALQNSSYAQNYITWNWIDPADTDFSKAMIYLNGIFKTSITKGVQFYNATGLAPDTSYTISTHTVDTSGNINRTWVNHTARTAPASAIPMQDENVVSIADNITARRGTNITVPIMIYNATGIAAVGINLSYNASVVNVTDASVGNFTDFFGFDNRNASKGWVTINTYILNTSLSGSITIASVTLEAAGMPGDTSPLNLKVLEMTDQNGTSVQYSTDNGTFAVASSPANPPVLESIGGRTVDEGKTLNFTVNAADPDGDALTYSANNLPAGAAFDQSNRTFSWTPGYDRSGTYPDVQFKVSDGTFTDAENITITVNDVTTPTPPLITNVASSGITGSGAAITWITDEPSTSQVEYGLDTGYALSTALDPSLVTGHNVSITGLTNNTLYHYRVKSGDAENNLNISEDHTFTTLQSISSNAGLWHFDENAGINTSDSSGNNNHGAIKGAAWVGGKIGPALQFDGASGYVEVLKSASLDNITDEITIMAWVKTPPGTRGTVIERWLYDPTPDRAYVVTIEADGSIQFLLSANGSLPPAGAGILTTAGKVSPDTWTHIAVTSNGTTMKAYINGSEDPGTASSPAGGIYKSAANLHVGAWQWGSTNRNDYFNGTIDEVKIYSRALGANEINTDYLKDISKTCVTQPSVTHPSVTHPSASPSIIPDDTDNDPRWGELSQLNVTVTGSIASVAIDISQIGGQPAQPMVNAGGNIWSVTANASAGTPPRTYYLKVNATDLNGISNTSVSIPLVVMKNGDVNGDNTVNVADAMLLANYVSYPGKYTISSEYVAEVTGNGVVNIGDAIFLATCVSSPGYTLR